MSINIVPIKWLGEQAIIPNESLMLAMQALIEQGYAAMLPPFLATLKMRGLDESSYAKYYNDKRFMNPSSLYAAFICTLT